jgi:hypothetical protein
MLFYLLNIDWISLTTAIAALLTAMATLGMAKQVKKQRETTYKSHISFDRAVFTVQASRKDEISFPKKWNEGHVSGFWIEDSENIEPNNYNLKLANIGLGTAKNIKINISFDLDGFIEQIKHYENIYSIDLRINIVTGEHYIFLNPGGKIPSFASMFSKKVGTGSHYNFIGVLPFNVNKEYTLVRLPLAFLELSNIYMFYWNMLPTEEKNKLSKPTIPILTVYISYEDISNKVNNQRFSISTEFFNIGSNYSGEFIFSEIN